MLPKNGTVVSVHADNSIVSRQKHAAGDNKWRTGAVVTIYHVLGTRPAVPAQLQLAKLFEI